MIYAFNFFFLLVLECFIQAFFIILSNDESFFNLYILQVNIMVLTRVVFITISTTKRRSLMMADSTSPMEQGSEQIR